MNSTISPYFKGASLHLCFVLKDYTAYSFEERRKSLANSFISSGLTFGKVTNELAIWVIFPYMRMETGENTLTTKERPSEHYEKCMPTALKTDTAR